MAWTVQSAGRVMHAAAGVDVAISDIEIQRDASGVYATTLGAGGLATLRLGDSGATLTDTHVFSATLAREAGAALESLSLGGESCWAIGGRGATGLLAVEAAATDSLDGAAALAGLAAGRGALTASVQIGGRLFTAHEGSPGIDAYGTATGALARLGSAREGTEGYAGEVRALASAKVGGTDFLLAFSDAADGISAWWVTPQGAMVLRGTMGAEKGLGLLDRPVALETVTHFGETYVIAASASGTGQAGALSVLRLEGDGALVPVDHLLDSLDTRFGQVQSLSVVQKGGWVHVVAAGGDDGMSVFALSPAGQLQHLRTVEASLDNGLMSVSAVAAAHVAGELQILAASEEEAGLARFEIDLDGAGRVLRASAGADTVDGTGGDDMIEGQGGHDLLRGMGGDDILIDGAGADTLVGGAGRDTFVLGSDGAVDRVLGFQVGTDTLDLSGYTMLYDASRLTVTELSNGARIDWFGERLVLTRAGGGAISHAEVVASVESAAYRVPLITDRDWLGSGAGDEITGDWTEDFMRGLAGNDTLRGQGGHDKLEGEGGADRLFGGAGNDEIWGGAGHDRLFGEDGFDTLDAGDGNDTVWGGNGRDEVRLGGGDDLFGDSAQGGIAGRDTVAGGGGDDEIRLGGGDDRAFGGAGRDLLFGGADHDLLAGGMQNDRLMGETGADTLKGDGGADTLGGGAGNDVLFGGAGDDVVWGGAGRDRAMLGGGDDLFRDSPQGTAAGNDTVIAGAGDDTVLGAGGSDRVFGGGGADRLAGGAGNDMLLGGAGNDTLLGGVGRDTLRGGAGEDRLLGGGGADIFRFGRAEGRDVVVDFEDGLDRIEVLSGAGGMAGLKIADVAAGARVAWGDTVVILEDVAAADLSAADFLF